MSNNKISRIFGSSKRSEATWLSKAPHLGESPIDLSDHFSEESLVKEREAIFRNHWLCVGREDLVQNPGSYVTRRIEILNTSIIIVRGNDHEIRSFHNICPHRGNQLVWQDDCDHDIIGRSSKFQCRYHGLCFSLEGKIEKITASDKWYKKQYESLSLVEVSTEIWNGFIFVNFSKDPPALSLSEYIGEPTCEALEGFPFSKFKRRSMITGTVKSNWKLLQDAYSEIYNAWTMHHEIMPGVKNTDPEFSALSHEFPSENVRSWSIPKFPAETNFFAFQKVAGLSTTGAASSTNSSCFNRFFKQKEENTTEWEFNSIFIFPNFILQFFSPCLVQTQSFWPTAHNEVRYEVSRYHLDTDKFSERYSQIASDHFFNSLFQRSIPTIEATQRGIESGVLTEFPLTDEEIQIRYFYWDIARRVQQQPNQNVD